MREKNESKHSLSIRFITFDNHFSILTHFVLVGCGVWEGKVGVQVFRNKRHICIYLDYIRVKFISCIKKNIFWYKNQLIVKLSLFLGLTVFLAIFSAFVGLPYVIMSE